MITKAWLDLTDLETYRRSCLEIAAKRLAGFASLDQIAAAEGEINAYSNQIGRASCRERV